MRLYQTVVKFGIAEKTYYVLAGSAQDALKKTCKQTKKDEKGYVSVYWFVASMQMISEKVIR